MTAKPKQQNATPCLALALQGGGAHGAFTWGVLLRLLDEVDAGRLKITAISGTSAGAMNAAVLADGLTQGGPQKAKEKLNAFWQSMADYSGFNPYAAAIPGFGRFNPIARLFDMMMQFVSPYQLNPLNVNPLRPILKNSIDFDALRNCRDLQLFISATNVRTNKLRVFTTSEMTLDALLASACLPHMYQAVTIDGEAYWDGGFMGNPVIEPLLGCHEGDVLVVQINPTRRDEVPTTAWDILDRVNEITFNASLMREIRTISNLSVLHDAGLYNDPSFSNMRFHLIDSGGMLSKDGVHGKYNTHESHLTKLRDRGIAQADAWLTNHKADIGKRTTLNLAEWRPIYNDFGCRI